LQKIETITAPTPLLGRLDQSALHRIAMHVPQLLHALPGREYVKVVKAACQNALRRGSLKRLR
jgi:hypothetical protein